MTMSNDLLETLALISKNLLRDQAVPDDLQKLWAAKHAGNDIAHDSIGLELLQELRSDLFVGYRLDDGVPATSVAGFERMFAQIAIFAVHEDGDLFGYWLFGDDPAQSVDTSPVVRLDTEGQFSVVGTTASEALLLQADDDDDQFATLRLALQTLGINAQLPVNHDEIYAKCDSLADPNELKDQFIAEEEARE